MADLTEALAAAADKLEAGGFDTPADVPASESSAPSEEAAVDAPSGGRDSGGRFVAKTGAPEAPPAPGAKAGVPDAPPAAGAKPTEAPALDVKPAEGDIDPDKPETWLPANRIPYQRFKSVLDARQAAEAKAAQLEQELAAARAVKPMFDAAMGQRGQTESDAETDLMAEIFGDQAAPAQFAPLQRKLDEMAQRLERFEHAERVRDAERRLDAELAAARQAYPDMDEAEVLDHVRLYGAKADIRGFVEARQEKVNAIKAQGVKEYLAAQARRAPASPTPSVAPAVPPRPPTSVPVGSSGGLMRGEFNLSNEEQRREYMRQRLQS